MASLPGIAVKFRAAANRSRLPEPLRLFAYVFETDANDLAWYDEVYNVITSSDPDHLSAQHWFGSTAFIRTVNLIATVHQLEQPTDAVAEVPIRKMVIHCLECNNQLVRLHPNTELQYHPALAHWVKTLLLWDQPETLDRFPEQNYEAQLLRVVVRYIKHIILEISQSPQDALNKIPSPSSFLKDFKQNSPEPKFNIGNYIEVLDNGGIPWRNWYRNDAVDDGKQARAHGIKLYKPSPENEQKTIWTQREEDIQEWYAPTMGPEAVPSRETAPANISKAEIHAGSRQRNERLTAEEIIEMSRKEPDQAQQMLVNLPIDLASMEIINGVLVSGQANLENPVIACNYIQHGLRKLEDSSSDGSTGTNDSEEPYSPSLDPEERKRKVKLLVLFIRNLIRRGLVPADSLQYDIQEICVRYAPIKEVRDLKHWFQTGEDL
ncbi:hypothetical protein DIS24_g3850 [Lasiodiplodia hormozganensis]|uniref:CCR4-NOT transcription complex subunit 11 n=1 Tax=Lasiodiplodia hormozganensis TaxID=869390 RepID=A0AA40D1X0_9PEZI|nr:hypothetical protein DIS24_g3850 [Lasiodiplodia hormozganensis]